MTLDSRDRSVYNDQVGMVRFVDPRAQIDEINSHSRIGQGDAFIVGGFISLSRGNSAEKCVAHKYRIKKVNSARRLGEEVDFRAWVAVYRTINATGR